MEKFITANGTAIRISDRSIPSAEAGARPVIVLLHGYLESLDVWDDFSKLLLPHFRVIAPDLPGHGISEVIGEVHTMGFLADTVKDALDVCGVDKCILAGHSMGGYVALEFMRRHAHMLQGLILLHSTPNPDTEEKKQNRQREIDLIDAGKKDLLETTVQKGFAEINRRRFASFIDGLAEQVILTEEDGIKAILRGMMEREDSNEMMKTSPVPQMMVFGKLDEYIPAEVAEAVAGNQPQAKTIWLEKSGHMGFVEEPQETAGAIIDFATRCMTNS